jgi:protein gp37
MTKRLRKMGQEKYVGGFNTVMLHPTAWQHVKKWKKPRRVFLNSMSDTFHITVPTWYIEWMFDMMRLYEQHIWMVLTKRSARMEDLCNKRGLRTHITANIWMGVTVEEPELLHRMEHLREVDAETRFVSFEPLLGDMGKLNLDGIQWVIVGCETGPGARPMNEQWVISIITQCQAQGVAVFYKQRMEDGKKISCPELLGRQWREYPDD